MLLRQPHAVLWFQCYLQVMPPVLLLALWPIDTNQPTVGVQAAFNPPPPPPAADLSYDTPRVHFTCLTEALVYRHPYLQLEGVPACH